MTVKIWHINEKVARYLTIKCQNPVLMISQNKHNIQFVNFALILKIKINRLKFYHPIFVKAETK